MVPGVVMQIFFNVNKRTIYFAAVLKVWEKPPRPVSLPPLMHTDKPRPLNKCWLYHEIMATNVDSHRNSELNDKAVTEISQSFDFGMITAEWADSNSNKEGGVFLPLDPLSPWRQEWLPTWNQKPKVNPRQTKQLHSTRQSDIATSDLTHMFKQEHSQCELMQKPPR